MKAVRGSSRFVGASTEQAAAGLGDLLGDGHALRFGLDGAGPSDQGDVAAADEDIASGSGDTQDGVFLLGIAAHQFVGLADGDALDDAWKGFEDAEVDGAVVAGNTDGGASGAGYGVSLESEAFDTLADRADLFLGGVGLHDYKHGRFP